MDEENAFSTRITIESKLTSVDATMTDRSNLVSGIKLGNGTDLRLPDRTINAQPLTLEAVVRIPSGTTVVVVVKKSDWHLWHLLRFLGQRL